jgi:superfamily II DNA or RNA helicase
VTPAVAIPDALPEAGQIVEVRRRRYVVQEVRTGSLPDDPLPSSNRTPQHLVALSSIEDDGLGEELSVVWEIEPGTRVFEKATLPQPTGFDPPERLDAFLDAVAWGAVASADVKALQAPFRSGIEIEDYQLDPVVRAIQMPRVSLLIADDVGLGKTIEAGLVVQELMLRYRARTVLVVCPASIQVQWRDQMRDKFGLEFRIVDTALMRELRRRRGLHVNPFTHFPRLVTSIDFLKRDRPLRLLREVLPGPNDPAYPRRFDLLIVDEAHNVAPSGRGQYAVDSQRTLAVRTLTPHFEHKLFLTATPHNGYSESFASLLALLDGQRFARAITPSREQLAAVMVRRLKSELPPKWDGTPRFPARAIEPIEVDYPEDERRAHALLVEYTTLRQQCARDGAQSVAVDFLLKLLKKRLFSSPRAFDDTLAAHLRSLRKPRAQRKVTSVAPGILRRQLEEAEEERADDDEQEETTAEAVDTATSALPALTAREEEILRELKTWSERAAKRADARCEALLAWLRGVVRAGDNTWSERRVIVFTEYRATQKWLQDRLSEAKLGGEDRLKLLYGGMNTEEREKTKAAFQADPALSPVRILLATDAASEGIDLQNHCSLLVHYEIPWNPNRMEQRNGRIDRHGQRAAVVKVHHFVSKGFEHGRLVNERDPGSLEGDLEFLFRAALKVEQIREDLGSVGDVIAAQVEEAMRGRRLRLDTAVAEKKVSASRAALKLERELKKQIHALAAQLDETRRALRVQPDNVRHVVEVGLELAGHPPLQPTTLEIPQDDPSPPKTVTAYHLPALPGSWALCFEGLEHPHTKVIRPVVFDPGDLELARDRVVLAHLNHRLVQMCLRLLRAEVWSRDGARRLQRATARVVPDGVLEGPALIAHGRLVVLGSDNRRLHEEILAIGVYLREGRVARMNLGDVAKGLAAATVTPVPEGLHETLLGLVRKHENALLKHLETRSAERTESLQRELKERADFEADTITRVLTELRDSITAKLGEAPVQLNLFSDPEREQIERDRESLRARVERIPAEITEEVALVRARYAAPSPRLFPLALTVLVPAREARTWKGAGHA